MLLSAAGHSEAVAAAATDSAAYHNLEELRDRLGERPDELLQNDDGTFLSEQTIFHDVVTGAEIRRVTNHPLGDGHHYYDLPPWNIDGTVLLTTRETEAGPRAYLSDADGSWLRPLVDDPNDPMDKPYWSYSDPNRLYFLRNGTAYSIDWTTGEETELFDLVAATGIPAGEFHLADIHPGDDRLLIAARTSGRVYAVNADGSGFTELIHRPEWETEDSIHRTRWAKDEAHSVFLGINFELVNGERTLVGDQYILNTQTGELVLTNVDMWSDNRASHPAMTMDGQYITGTYSNDTVRGMIGMVSVTGDPSTARVIVEHSGLGHHSSNSFDGRWHVFDTGPDPKGKALEVRGLTTADALTLVSMDGYTRQVLNYHFTSFAEWSAHPHMAWSPDGTKLLYQSDMIRPADLENEQTRPNIDSYEVVVRRPFAPDEISVTMADGGGVRLSWQRPDHAPGDGFYWNPGNESQEIAGYVVLRAETSGGPYVPIHDGLVTETEFVDTTAEAGRPYFYVVQSVEHSGLASLYSEEVFGAFSTNGNVPDWAGPVRHVYEAELATLDLPIVRQMDWLGASGGWYVGTFAAQPDPNYPLPNQPAAVTFDVEAPVAGEYSVWARVAGFDASGTFSVTIDGADAGSIAVAAGSSADGQLVAGNWHWVELASDAALSAGTHAITFSTSDAAIALDQIVVTTDPNVVPDGLWGDNVAPDAPTNVQVTSLGEGINQITWTPSTSRDVRYYNVYAGTDPDFEISQQRLVYSPSADAGNRIIDWGITDGRTRYYKVTAVDRFGNESPLDAPPQNTPPTISDIADRQTNEDVPTEAIAFTIGDAETPAEELAVTVASDNTAVINADGLQLSGSGANRSLVLNPVANAFGTATITVTVTDADGASTVETFTLTVHPINDLPTVSEIGDITVTAGDAIEPITVTIGDVETPAADLVVTAASNNAELLPEGSLTLSGSGAERTLSIRPAPGRTGTATISLTVTDTDGGSATETLTLTVQPPVSNVLEYRLPDGNGTDRVTLRRAGEQLVVVDDRTGRVLASNPVAATDTVRLIGSDREADHVTVDFVSGGLFLPEHGIHIASGSGPNDTVTIAAASAAAIEHAISPDGHVASLSWTNPAAGPIPLPPLSVSVAASGTDVLIDQVAATERLVELEGPRGYYAVLQDASRQPNGEARLRTWGPARSNLRMAGGAERFALLGSRHDDRVIVRNLETRFADQIVVAGRGGDDFIDARTVGIPLVLSGGSGNDRIIGGRAGDVILGGDGNDSLFGAAGNDRIYGGAGSDRLFAGAGRDELFGGDGDDWLFGNLPQDRFDGGPGRDFINGRPEENSRARGGRSESSDSASDASLLLLDELFSGSLILADLDRLEI